MAPDGREGGSLFLVSLSKNFIITFRHIVFQVVWKNNRLLLLSLAKTSENEDCDRHFLASHGSFQRTFVPIGCCWLAAVQRRCMFSDPKKEDTEDIGWVSSLLSVVFSLLAPCLTRKLFWWRHLKNRSKRAQRSEEWGARNEEWGYTSPSYVEVSQKFCLHSWSIWTRWQRSKSSLSGLYSHLFLRWINSDVLTWWSPESNDI